MRACRDEWISSTLVDEASVGLILRLYVSAVSRVNGFAIHFRASSYIQIALDTGYRE